MLHPAYPMTFEATKGYEMTGGLALMFDTTIALGRLILAGVLEQHPNLAARLPACRRNAALSDWAHRSPDDGAEAGRGEHRKAPSEYLNQIWLDTVSPIALAIRYGCDFVGTDRMLYASDHPWVDPGLIAGQLQSLKLPASDEAKIFSGNARRLFRLDGSSHPA